MTLPSPCSNQLPPPFPIAMGRGGGWKRYILLRFNLSPSNYVENVYPIMKVRRFTGKSFPLRPQSSPLGTWLSTHLATWHLPLDSQYCPQPSASGNIESLKAWASGLSSPQDLVSGDRSWASRNVYPDASTPSAVYGYIPGWVTKVCLVENVKCK